MSGFTVGKRFKVKNVFITKMSNIIFMIIISTGKMYYYDLLLPVI